MEDLSIRDIEYLVSLSRILVNYGYSHTYESFENACLLLLADYDRTKEAVDMAVDRLRISASRLYADKTETDFLWTSCDMDDPWALLVKILTEGGDESVARRNHYLKRLAKLASLDHLANTTLSSERDEVAFMLSPLQLEMEFSVHDDFFPGILSLHANRACSSDKTEKPR